MSVLDTTRTLAHALPEACELEPGVQLYAHKQLSLLSADAPGSVCAIGAFDGVHLGHRALIEATIKDAQTHGLVSFAVTFNPDPARVLNPERSEAELLCTEDRIRLLLSLGLDGVVVVDFTKEFAAHTYQEFLDAYLCELLSCKSIHVGTNFCMGAGGKGTPQAMSAYATERGVELHAHELETLLGYPISSTRIRSLLRAGKVVPVTSLLARPHVLRGTVEHGRGQGTSFGFPTANIRLNSQSCIPAEGVYAAWVGTGERMWPSAVNVGAPRTFGGKANVPLAEATLLGFEGDLYGQELMCCFVEWLRAPQHFPTLEKLEKTVLANIDYVRTTLGGEELSD